MAVHFDPKEMRDWHGRWAVRVGEKPPTDSAKVFTMHRMEVEARIAELPKGKRISLNGVTIDNIPSKGLRVRVGKESKFYDTPEAAAKVVLAKAHHTDISTTTVRERAVRKIAQPEPPPVAGPHGVPAIPVIPKFRTRYPGRTPENDKTIRLGIRHATDIQRAYVPHIVNNTTVDVAGPTALKRAFGNYASRQGTVPTLTNADLAESRRTGEPPRSSEIIGIKGHMNIKPDLFIANNRASTLQYQMNTRWWVPVNTEKYSLADVVIAHEIGHGTHGQLNVNGIVKFSWTSEATTQQQMDFWNGMADAIGISRPKVENAPLSGSMSDLERMRAAGITGQPMMYIDAWFQNNRERIQQKVSTYGGRKNVRELCAELWCEYTLSDNPRPAARYYGDFVMKHIGGAKGGK